MPQGSELVRAYRMPREPSTPRVTVWRRLRELGALRLVDGLVALPGNDRTVERLEWIGQVIECNGETTVWMARPCFRRDDRPRRAAFEQVGAAVAR